MATSARAQELAEQLLGLEATRTPLPGAAASQHFGAGVTDIYRNNKKTILIGGAVVVGAAVLFWGFKKMQEKNGERNSA